MADGRLHSVLFVATENDSVYALDANNPKAGPRHDGVLWHVSFINPARGVTTVSSNSVGVQDITPQIGITGTPTIDPATNAIYLVAKTESIGRNGVPVFAQKLYALDLATGRTKFGGPATIGTTTFGTDGAYINATAVVGPGTGAGSVYGQDQFNALRGDQRAGLAFDANAPGARNGLIVVAFGSHGDINPYHGWLIGYDPRTLKMVTVFDTTPNGSFGAIWQGGAAPSIAANGDILATAGNGTFDAFASTVAPGPAALGASGPGLGYAGIDHSVAVKFDAVDPNFGQSGTGLYVNGTTPVPQPTAPNVHEGLRASGINFNAAANDPAGPHTFKATLAYNGSTLTESLVDQTTGASYTHAYSNVNIPAAVGRNTAYVGFGGGDDGLHSIQNVTSWTYTAGRGSTPTIDHSAGFAANSDLTANGVAAFTGAAAGLTDGMGEESATVFANNPVDVRSFTTTFTFQFAPDPGAMSGVPIGDGITFILQDSTGHPAGKDYGETVLRLRPTPAR